MKKLIYLTLALVLSISSFSFAKQDVSINILHINDTHSNYSKGGKRNQDLTGTKGGMAKATSVIGYARQQDPEALLFHIGDFFMGDLHFYFNYGVPELLWMKQMGFNAAVIGNHEFDITTAGLIQTIDYAKSLGGDVPLFSSNLTSNSEYGDYLKSMLRDWDTITVHGVKVGYFGLTSPAANMTSSSLPDILVEGESPDILMGIIAEKVSILKSEGAKIIICLSHLGLANDEVVAKAVQNIDVIIGGHDHFEMDEPKVIHGKHGAKTYIVQAGAFFENVGSIQMKIKNGKLHKFDYELIKLNSNIPDEPNVEAMVEGLINDLDDGYKSLFTQQIAEVKGTLDELAVNITQKGDHTTSVGSLIADALKNFGQTDIGFTTGGLSAQKLYKGPIVTQDVAKMVGYGVNETNLIGYNLVTFDISGYALKEGMKFCLSTIETDDEYLPQVSGMSYKYCQKNPDILEEIMINGQEISDEAIYSMTTNYVTYSILSFIGIPTDNVVVFNEASEIFVVAEYIAGIGEIYPLNDSKRVLNICKRDEDNKLSVNESEIAASMMNIYPNPANEIANIDINLVSDGIYSIEIFNLENLKVTVLESEYFVKGNNYYSINVQSFSAGNYLIRFTNGDNSIVSKLNIVR
jgi:5'-nucleotidase